MKSLSKLHQEAIIRAQNETDQNKAAFMEGWLKAEAAHGIKE